MKTVNNICNNKNYILILKKEDIVLDLPLPSTSTNELSTPIYESKRMKGICMNIKEKLFEVNLYV